MKDISNLYDYKHYHEKKGQVPKRPIEQTLVVVDVVGFSEKMFNNKMLKIVDTINNSIFEILDPEHFWNEKEADSILNNLIMIPTGDGYAIAFSNTIPESKILKLAIELYKRFKEEKTPIRMGITRGRNIIAKDLNETLNVFGYGIVLATRVCAVAEKWQILIHSGLADSLEQDKSIEGLQRINKKFKVKHGLKFNCYNYYKEGEFGINIKQK